MSQYVETATRALTAGVAIAQYLRVKLVAGLLQIAGVSDLAIGTMEEASFANGDVRAVRLRTAQGTRKVVANGAITQGTHVYSAAAGQVGSAVTGYPEGIALEAAANAGDVIEVLESGIGLKWVYGQQTTVTAADTVVTGLNKVLITVASMESDPLLTADLVTAQVGNQAGAPVAGSIVIKTWEPTSNANPTMIAATTFGKLVNWVACGT